MASAKSLLVGILLLSCVCSSLAGYFYRANATEITGANPTVAINNDGTPAEVSFTVSNVVSGTDDKYDGEISISVFLRVTHNHASELKVELVVPAAVSSTPLVILRGSVHPSCQGSGIRATFSPFAGVPHHNPFERCDTSTILVSGFIRPAQASKFTPAAGTNIAGTYTIRVRDLNTADTTSGVINEASLIISDDVDQDSVTNDDDNCPLVANPTILYKGVNYQADENQNLIGNECECAYRNYHVPAGDMKICYYLDNWGSDGHHYKGQFKQRGDWVSLIMPNRNLGEFQPGDYSHKNTWLDCDCVSWTILP